MKAPNTGLPVPKLLKWEPTIPQMYSSDCKILLTSGCSFTAWTSQLEFCATWPGFVLDRVGFDHCIDYSYTAVGNLYIANSIRYQLDQLTDEEAQQYFVMVMWSGLNRLENIKNSYEQPKLGSTSYVRYTRNTDKLTEDQRRHGAEMSADQILGLKAYLEQRGISYIFSTYVNLLYPPYIPKMDTTHEFEGWTSDAKIKQLKEIAWVPNKGMDFLYEYGFRTDTLDTDGFHPSLTCSQNWTDEILLPELERRGLVRKKVL